MRTQKLPTTTVCQTSDHSSSSSLQMLRCLKTGQHRLLNEAESPETIARQTQHGDTVVLTKNLICSPASYWSRSDTWSWRGRPGTGSRRSRKRAGSWRSRTGMVSWRSRPSSGWRGRRSRTCQGTRWIFLRIIVQATALFIGK